MSTPDPLPDRLSRFPYLIGLALLLPIVVVGWVLVVDRPGLEAEYFALGEPWTGRVLATEVGEPRLGSSKEARAVLMSPVGFSIRWSGWWHVAAGGQHSFTLAADDGGYLKIDGEVVADTAGFLGEAVPERELALAPGFHHVEVGLSQRNRDASIEVAWTPPGATTAARLAAADLYPGRPLTVRRTLRGLLAGWPRPVPRLLGLSMILFALMIAVRSAPPGLAAWRARPAGQPVRDEETVPVQLPVAKRRIAGVVLPAALFVATFLTVLPFTGFLLGGDDAAYPSAAMFNTREWFANRYGHVYLLKLFTVLTGGEPLVGVRYWWSFAFATTVAALGVAVRSIGPGLQLRTLVAAVFVLVSQTTVMGLIGAGFADYTAMMFLTLAVAIYLHGLRDRGETPARHEWGALALGAASFAAMRSKEVSAVLFLLPVLFLFADGRFAPRRFVRRLVYWTAGVVGVLLLLMALDGLIVGDPFFTGGGGERFEKLEKMNFPDGRKARPNQDWVKTIWPARHADADLSLRFLWLGVCAAALVAAARHRRLELRLLHLLPIAYLGALIVLYVRLPHPFSPRMLIAIAPMASLMVALLLHYTGLDDLSWRELLSPAALAPGALFGGLVCFVFVPYRTGSLPADQFLPVDLLRRFGWSPDHFVDGVLVPAVFLAAVGAFALGAGRPSVRVAALVVAFLAAFGTGFSLSWLSLSQHRALQAGELLAYPWRVFAAQIDDVPSATIGLSRDLHTHLNMTAQTRSSLARLALGRKDVWVGLERDFPRGADLAIASRDQWRRWRADAGPLESALVETAEWDPLGLLVLVRPKAVAEQAQILEWLRSIAGEVSPDGTSDGVSPSSAGADGREVFLRGIQGDPAPRMRPVAGTRLHAINVHGDGWTYGTRPAGVVAMNRSRNRPMEVALALAVSASSDRYPIRVSVDDGTRVETLVFERAGTRRISLRPVPPRSSHLVVVWSDKDWAPPPPDTRRLGVRILAPEEG